MLSITDLSIRLAGRLLIDQSSVQITPGSRVGMVGRNGTGKSTLFKVIRGELAAEHGTVTLPPRWRVGSLAQEAPNGPESLISVVLKADLERDALLTEAESATDPHRIAEIQTRLVDIDAHSAPSRAAAILSGLGFSAADQLRPCAEFSGGWRMRVALAATLFAAPDLLLLDEPTNYLDLEGTLWLEDHLAHYPRTVIVISHDRDLLESSVDQILHLERGKLTLYKGTYSSFEEQRAMREMLDAKAVKRQEAERARLQAFVDRFKAKASKARQAQSRVKMLERLKPITALVTQDVREISFPAPEKILSPPIIAADNVVVGYDPNTPVLNRVTLRVDNDDRIALLGSNGNGKSTLVKLLAGRLAPFSGKVTRADKLSIAYFAQHQLDELNEDASTYDHVRKLMGEAPEAKVRARAGAIGFSGKAADTKVGKLSGGEKARLLLGLATFFGPNMIILDEPTNHLDIDSRAALAEAINEFPGAVIMVSHDRYLIEFLRRSTLDRRRPHRDQLRRRPRRISPPGAVRAQWRARAARTQRGEREAAASEIGQSRLAEETHRGSRNRDRPRQRDHQQDRHRARPARHLQPRPQAGRPTVESTRQCGRRAGTCRGAVARGEHAVRRGGGLTPPRPGRHQNRKNNPMHSTGILLPGD